MENKLLKKKHADILMVINTQFCTLGHIKQTISHGHAINYKNITHTKNAWQ